MTRPGKKMTRQPALAVVAVVLLATGVSAQSPAKEQAGIEAWLKGYDAALISKDVAKLVPFYHPDVTILGSHG